MKKPVLLLLSLLAATVVSAQIDTYEKLLKLKPKTVAGVRSTGDGEHYTVLAADAVVRYDYRTGRKADTLYSPSQGSGLPTAVSRYALSPDEKKILLGYDSKPLYRHSAYSRYAVWDIASRTLTPLGESDSIRYAVFSPTGNRVAYVWENDIYVYDLADGKRTRVTDDGAFNRTINGLPDWVYEEEFSLDNLLRWSPDGSRIAYVKSDESRVREFVISRFDRTTAADARDTTLRSSAMPYYTVPYSYKYPVAGEENSLVSLHVYDLASGKTVTVDTGREADRYLPYLGWTPGGDLYFFRLNRRQNHLELLLAAPNGTSRVVYEERSPRYIDLITPSTVTFLPDSKRFIVRNETESGFYHMYLYHVDEGLQHPITGGEWEVTGVAGVSGNTVWYLSTEGSPLRRNLYRIDLDGRNKKRLTPGEGTYSIAPGKDMKYYIAYFSNVSTPPVITLYDGRGRVVRTLEDNKELRAEVERVGLPRKRFFSFTAAGGYDLNGFMILPADFDSTRQYPVMMTQYSGPGSQQAADRWSLDWEDVLVQHGVIVACVDGRGTGFRGEAFKKQTYGQLGALETEDQIEAARWLAQRPFVDGGRIGIYGWSYGGFMALNCMLRGNDVFKVGISVAPVTSWRYYDSVYTERYNGLPQDNAAGYDDYSPVNHADSLKGKLLLMHGTADDNVHILNAYRMVRELNGAGKDFDLLVFPDDNHSMMPSGRNRIRQKMVDYVLENL